jgi:hypothetical protein
MSRLDELLSQPPPSSTRLPATVLGRAANSVTTPDDDLYVTIGSFDGHRQQWGPCQWAPANALPTRGDDVLVVFDESQVPWVIAFTWGSRTVSGSVVAPAPASSTDPLYANVDGVRIGPMPWSPRDHIPQLGDQLLVQFDEDGNPWAMLITLPPPPPPPTRTIAYDQIAANVPLTGTTPAAANIVIAGTAKTYDGTPVRVSFFCSHLNLGVNSTQADLMLFRDATQLVDGWCEVAGANNGRFTVFGQYRDVPPAGSHAYTVKGYSNGGGTGVVTAGAAGPGPAFLRVELDA